MPRQQRDPERTSAFPRIPRLSDLADVSEELIAFVEKYQQIWECESKAMLALGEFLGARSDSMRNQVDLMRMGGDTFRRYTAWSEALLDFSPERFFPAWLQDFEQRTRPQRAQEEAGAPPPETTDV